MVSLYELFFDIVEGSLNLSFLARPVAGTCIKFCSQMSCHKQGMGIITDLHFVPWIIFDDQCCWIIDQKLQGYSTKIFKQFLDCFINGYSIGLQGKTDCFLSGCWKYHWKTVNSCDHAINRDIIRWPVEPGLISWRAFMPYSSFGTDVVFNILVNFWQIPVNRANASCITSCFQFSEDPCSIEKKRFASPFDDLFFEIINLALINCTFIHRCLFFF